MAENRIGNEGAEAMSNMLLKNDMIHTVDLSGNNINDDGAEFICQMLMVSKCLSLWIRIIFQQWHIPAAYINCLSIYTKNVYVPADESN